MKILTDVDGVLLNWETAFHDWMMQKGCFPKSFASYDIWDCYPHLNKDYVIDRVHVFNASAAMGFLSPLNDAVYWTKRMYEYHGVTFHCISSMGTDVYARRLRKENLERIFGNIIEDVTILGCGEDKTAVLSKYTESGTIWLEDNFHNANVGGKQGLRTFLFNRTYNTPTGEDEHFYRISGWEQLYGILFPTG